MEIEAMLQLDHPCVVKFYEFFEQRFGVCVITELCDCGDISELLGGCCQEGELQALFRDIVTGTAYCHGKGIAHCDLKMENCLLTSGKHRRVGKIVDFGLAQICRDESQSESWLSGTSGTRMYTAPEVYCHRHYSVKCDMWSLGIMLYFLLTGKAPYNRAIDRKTSDRIKEGHYHQTPLMEASIDPLARELTRGLLVLNPKERLSAAAALEEP